MRTFYAPMAVADMYQSVITRAIEFYDKIGQLDESIHTMSTVIFEFLSFVGPTPILVPVIVPVTNASPTSDPRSVALQRSAGPGRMV